jgi:REP element-mobilizing transposase RayT
MARPLRIEFPGAVYHITSRGNGRQRIFQDDVDNRKFLELLGKTIERFHWACHAYCLMVNHYHLLIETPEANLSKGMHHLNAGFCQAYNRRHDTVGHLLQGRFKAIVVDRESYLLELARYIVLNPVRAGMVDRPEDWPWSSYCATAGLPAASVAPEAVTLAGAAATAASSPGSAISSGAAATAVSSPGSAATSLMSAATLPTAAPSPVATTSTPTGAVPPIVAASDAPVAVTAAPAAAGAASIADLAAATTASAAADAINTATATITASAAASTTASTEAATTTAASVAAAAGSAAFTSPSWLLSQFGPDDTSARRRYRDFVAAGIGKESPWTKLQSQIFLGKETFMDRLKETIPEKKSIQEIPKLQRYADRPSLREIFGDWKTRRKRNEAIIAGYFTYGYEQKEIAQFLGVHYTSVCRVIKRHRDEGK